MRLHTDFDDKSVIDLPFASDNSNYIFLHQDRKDTPFPDNLLQILLITHHITY